MSGWDHVISATRPLGAALAQKSALTPLLTAQFGSCQSMKWRKALKS